jgi:hypothetical protein
VEAERPIKAEGPEKLWAPHGHECRLLATPAGSVAKHELDARHASRRRACGDAAVEPPREQCPWRCERRDIDYAAAGLGKGSAFERARRFGR